MADCAVILYFCCAQGPFTEGEGPQSQAHGQGNGPIHMPTCPALSPPLPQQANTDPSLCVLGSGYWPKISVRLFVCLWITVAAIGPPEFSQVGGDQEQVLSDRPSFTVCRIDVGECQTGI